MDEVIQFAILGLGLGSLYALIGQGVVIIYRGSGVLNLAQGAIGIAGAFLWWEMHIQHGVSFPIAFICGVAF
jgi:sulfate-transporting ATPase